MQSRKGIGGNIVKNDLFNDRISRFSIRKLHVGVCSVLLGTLVMLGTAANVSADEVTEDKKVEGVVATTEVESPASLPTVEAEKTPETTYQADAAPVVSTEVKPELNSEKLAAYVAEIEANVANGKYSNKTDESVEILKVGLANAKNALTSATSQAELDAAYQSLVTIVNDKLKEKEVPTKPATAEEKIAAGAEAPASEDAPKRRSRRALGDANDPNLIADDVEDATSTPKVEKPGYSTSNAKEFTKQINWLDFGDTANWTNTTTGDNGQTALQVGSTYTKEIMPGYVVTVKVKSLKPFQATEIYKKRMEERGATAEEKATYDPNAKNGVVSGVMTPATKEAFKNGEEAKIIADPQNRWTEIRQEGINTGTKQTTIGSELNGSNIGVQFEISATFRGKSVKPAVVMADGESANPGELVLFTTNGTGWQHVGEWKKGPNGQPYVVQDTNYLFDPANGFINNKPVKVNGAKLNGLNLQLLIKSDQVGPDKKPVAWKYFGSADLTTGGLGTGVFGPNYSSGNVSVPLVMTRGASEIGLYIASSGKQAAMLGFFPLDEGDAPESYGKASHAIGTVDGVTGGKVSQPYLGDVSPDMDENNKGDWEGDDKSVTADEGIDQLLPDDLKGATNEMIKLDRTRPGNYTLKVEAHTDGADKAYLYGWIDFNQNGKFDDNERSDLATITQDGTVELKFNNGKAITDPTVTELGVRVRIAKDAKEIESPTGMALSGEVEDFKTQVTFPPKGERKETSDVQGAKQSATIAFTPQGLTKYSRTQKAVIDEKVAPVMIDNKTKQVVTPGADGYYAVAGQGKYKITANGKDVDVEFIPEDNFVGTADGISIRRTDNNGNDTDWNSKDATELPSINEVLDNMDGLYIPTVTPKNLEGIDKETTDVQGATQLGTPTFAVEGTNSKGEKVTVSPSGEYPAKFVDPTTGQVTDNTAITVPGEGEYSLNRATGEVTFRPEPGFVGTAKGVTLSLTAPVGRDKNGDAPAEAIKTATAKYIPTVTPVTITPTNKESVDIQNVPQTQTPTFDLSSDKTAKITSKKLVDPATGQPTDETTVTVAGEGTYTIDPTTGAVTFTPEKDFVGTAKGVTVQATATITNANGKTATITSDAKYTPTVLSAAPTAQPATSKDIQGAVQTGTPTFAGATVNVNGQDKQIPLKENSYKLLDKDGNEVLGTTPAYAEDGTTPIGTFSIDSTTGKVTFTPTDKSYTGKVTPVKVQAESTNGLKVDTTYTPEIVPVTPTATPAETINVQGATQKGKPEFKGGTADVDGVEKAVVINEAVPAKFDDGTTSKKVEGVGTYTVAPDGTVTFVPEKSFVGKAPAVTVVREDMNGTKASATYTPTVTPVTPTATPAESVAPQGVVQTGTVTFTEGDPVAPIDKDTITLLDENGQPAASVDAKSPDGKVIGTFTVDKATGVVTFTPTDKSYSGDVVPVKVQAKDANGTAVETTYTPKITPVVPTGEDVTSTDIQGKTQTGKPNFTEGNPSVPMDDDTPATFEDGSTTKVVPGEGTYTVAPDGTVTFVPEKSFTGTGTGVTVKRVDKNGTPVTAKYTPTVTPVTPTATPAESVAPQGVVQTGTVTFTEGDPVAPIDKDTITLLDENGQPAASVVAKSPEGKEIGTFTVDKATGVVTFTPTDKTYSGDVVAVKVQAKDANGTAVETTYTPKITPVVPTGEDVTSTDIQGKTQTGKPKFTEGDPSVPMDDDVPATFEDGSTTKTIPGEGTYTVAPDGSVTFVPEKSFIGTGTGVTVKRVDKNGTPVTAKYTPTVTPVTPTAEEVTSIDKQGQTQTGKPKFTEGDPVVPMDDDTPATFEDGSTTKTIPGEGTYTVAPDGTVTFVPEKSFTGTGTGVTVKRVDKNGTPVTAKYTPTVTPVTPTATPAESVAPQGVVQTGTVTFTEGDPVAPIDKNTITLLDENGQPVTSVVAKSPEGKEIGTFTVDKETGVVTFTPTDKSYSGEVVPVKVQAKDANGTAVETTYTPKITPVVPTGEDVTSTDIQGKTQTGKPNFTEGNPSVPMDDDTPATFEDGSTTKVVPGEGTYTVAPDGTVTFVPEKSFTGTGTGVTVKRVDKNGTPVTAKYTPTVTPVTPTAEPVTSIGPKGKEQSGKPTFKEGDSRVPMNDDVPATFEDGSTTKTVEGVGTYTVAPDGTVTFKPEPEFTGTAPSVTVVREDMNGTKASATYTPTVTPVTTFVDKDGKPIPGYPTEDGEQPKAEIPGYRFVETKKLPNGDTVHVYEKVKTSHKDKDGNEIPGYPTEDGENPKKDIPGYRFVETKKLPNGDTEHVYEKVKTSHKDKDGNEIPGYPTEDGENPKKDIPGYRFVETKKLPNGDTEHVYEKVKTSHKDKDGNEIPGYPTEDGENPKKDIPGYRFVETKKLPNGDTVHVYEKITTTHVDENGNLIPGYPTEDGEQPKKDIPGYEFVKTVVDANGNIQHIYKKVVTPEKPEAPVKPAPAKENAPQLPNTGTEDHASLAALGLVGVLSGFGLIARKKKED